MSMTDRQRWTLRVIVGVALALRLAMAIAVQPLPPLLWQSGDQYSYYHYGIEMAEGRGYISYVTGEATAYYPIGYPALLAALYFVVLHTPIPDDLMLATALFHVVVSTASVALVFVIGRAMAGVRTGLLAAAILAIFPNPILYVVTIQLETVFTFLVLAAIAVLATHDWETGLPSRRRLVAFGAVLGLAVLVRPFAAVLLVGLAGGYLASRAGWRATVGAVAVSTAVVVAMSVPWTIRNAVAMDAFVPSSTNMGDTLCIDRNLDAQGGFRIVTHDGCVAHDLPEVERNRGNTRKAIEFVLEHPGRELLQIVRRAGLTFADDHDGIIAIQTLGGDPVLSDRTVDVVRPLADGYYYVVLVLGVAGLPLLAGSRARPVRLLVASALVGLTGIVLLLWGNPRFHVPLLPLLSLCAALAISSVVERWRATSS